MQIGIDACCWSNRRGFGRFTRELLLEIIKNDTRNEYLFFVDSETAATADFPESVTKIVVPTRVSPGTAASAEGRRSVPDLWAFSRSVLNHKLDMFFFPAVYSYFPILNRTKIIVTVHDVIAEHHPQLVFPNKKLRRFWTIKQKLAIWQSNLILTVSESSKEEIVKFFNVPASRVRVISEAAQPIFKKLEPGDQMRSALKRQGLRDKERFILYVGGISPHKNLARLIDAFAILSSDPELSGVKLVLVGDYKFDSFFSAYPSLSEKVNSLGLKDKIVFTGFVDDADLVQLYNAATVFVLPSLDEGFGLPAIEAMSCGTAVAASNRGSLPEVIGDSGAFFDPMCPKAISAVLKSVLSNPQLNQEMGDRGLERSKSYGWSRAASEALAVFQELSTGQCA